MGGWQQGFLIMGRMSGSTSWGGQRVSHEGAGPQGGLDPLPIDHPCSLYVSPRVLSVLPRSWTTRSAMAATPWSSQPQTSAPSCPAASPPPPRWVGGAQPQLGGGGRMEPRKLEWGRGVGKDCPVETPKSKSPVLVSATHPNSLCDFEEVNELLCVVHLSDG